jgi:hypothetical protein
MTDLEKIDALRQRMGLNYAEAKLALDGAEGDLIKALIVQEREKFSAREQIMERGEQTWGKVKGSAAKVANTRLRLKKGEKTLFTLPAPVGALGLVGALASTQFAVLGLVGTAVALANRCSLEIEQPGNSKTPHEGFDNLPHQDI